jgi:polar amino acid transport system substrate-binding protein
LRLVARPAILAAMRLPSTLAAALLGSVLVAAGATSGCRRDAGGGGVPDLWTSSTIYRAKKAGRLVVLMEAEFRPFTWKDEGRLVGFDVDLAREIGKELGVEVEFRERSWDLLAAELLQGKGDLVISGVTATAERALEVSFSDPYYLTRTIALVAKPRADGVARIGDLDDPARRIVVQKASTGEHAARRHLPRARVDTFDTESACALEVAQGRADAFVYDELQVRAHAAQHPGATRVIDETLSFEPYAIECRKGDPETVAWLNLVLATLRRDGRLDELYKKHLPGVRLPSQGG